MNKKDKLNIFAKNIHKIKNLQKNKRLIEVVLPTAIISLSTSQLNKFFGDLSSSLKDYFDAGKNVHSAIKTLKDSDKDDDKVAYKIAAEMSNLIDKDISNILNSLKKSITQFSSELPDKRLVPGIYLSVLASKLASQDLDPPKKEAEKEGYEKVEDLNKLKQNQIIEVEKSELSTDKIEFGNTSFNVITKNKKVKFEANDGTEYNFIVVNSFKDQDDGKEYSELKFLSKQEFK